MAEFHKEIMRSYSKSSLERWFAWMQSDWEKWFSELELSRGRDLYKHGRITELELSENDALIRLGRGAETRYAVVQWEDSQLKVRGSMEQKDEAASIAVAGLYEIEALIADEIDPLPQEKNTEKDVPEAESGESADATAVPGPPSRENDHRDARNLLLRFYANTSGLHMEALWMKGKIRTPVFTQGNQFSQNENQKEREQIIRLVGRLRKTRFSSSKNGFVLSDVASILSFLSGDLKTLEKYFAIELDASVEPLRKGNREAKIEIEIHAHGENQLKLDWKVLIGKTELPSHVGKKLIHRLGLGPQIVPEIGIVSVPEETARKLLEWEPILAQSKDGVLPRYMMFSLFAGNAFPVQIDRELSTWFEHIAIPDGNPHASTASLPDFLRPYQKRGVSWLLQQRDQGCHPLVADEMGLGKTLQVLTLIAQFPVQGQSALVVCPASVVPVWIHEAEKFFPQLRIAQIRNDMHFSAETPVDLWISSYSQLRSHQQELAHIEFGYAVLDEAQMVKNPDAKSTQACLDIRARNRIVMTGTPVENKHCDIWTLFRFLMPGLLGPRKHFETLLENEGQRFLDKLSKQLAPFILRRTKREVVQELPEKTEMDIVCALSDMQVHEYRLLAEHGIRELGSDISKAIHERAMSLFALLTRLRQVCCDPGLLPWKTAEWQYSGKIQMLLSQLDPLLMNNHRIVIFSQFVSFLNRIREAIESTYPDAALYELTGKTQDRSKPVKEFQGSKGGSIMLVSLRAGGTGITLHAADYVFLMDPWWNPAVENQAIDRVHRIGQDKPVFVYRMVTEGTIEKRIQELKNQKRDLFDRIIGNQGDISDFTQYFKSLNELIGLSF